MSAHAEQRGPGLWDEVCSPKMQWWPLLALADLFVINRPHTQRSRSPTRRNRWLSLSHHAAAAYKGKGRSQPCGSVCNKPPTHTYLLCQGVSRSAWDTERTAYGNATRGEQCCLLAALTYTVRAVRQSTSAPEPHHSLCPRFSQCFAHIWNGFSTIRLQWQQCTSIFALPPALPRW